MAASYPVIFLFQLVGDSQALGCGRELKRGLFCSSKQQLLLLEENSVHVADCDSEVLCDA